MPKPTPYAVQAKNVSHVVICVLAGDNNLEREIWDDLIEIRDGCRDRVAALVLADFPEGAIVAEISEPTDLSTIESLGPIDTGDPKTLSDFLGRALVSYPTATRIALAFGGHGSGVFEEYEPASRRVRRLVARPPLWRRQVARWRAGNRRRQGPPPPPPAMLNDASSQGLLSTRELGVVLDTAFKAAGIAKVDALLVDVCFGAMVEVLTEVARFADVFVASEVAEFADGWNYRRLFELLSAQPPQVPSSWAKRALRAFREEFENRYDDDHPATLSGFRTSDDLVTSFRQVVAALEPRGTAGFALVTDALKTTQKCGHRDMYDLRDFATNLRALAGTDAALKAGCSAVQSAVKAARVGNVALGKLVPRANGLALWVPDSLFTFGVTELTYKQLAFDARTGWSSYLGPVMPA